MSKFDAKDVADNKAVAALSYISILFLVPLLLKKDSPFAKAHAKQGLILFLYEVVASSVPILNTILWLVAMVLAIMGIMKVMKGEDYEIPVIGKFAEKFEI